MNLHADVHEAVAVDTGMLQAVNVEESYFESECSSCSRRMVVLFVGVDLSILIRDMDFHQKEHQKRS
jgi:hypothetical protein